LQKKYRHWHSKTDAFSLTPINQIQKGQNSTKSFDKKDDRFYTIGNHACKFRPLSRQLNCNLPIKAMETNKPIYKLLTQETLSDLNTPIFYCHCFLIIPEFRRKGLIYKLYAGMGIWLEQKGSWYHIKVMFRSS